MEALKGRGMEVLAAVGESGMGGSEGDVMICVCGGGRERLGRTGGIGIWGWGYGVLIVRVSIDEFRLGWGGCGKSLEV